MARNLQTVFLVLAAVCVAWIMFSPAAPPPASTCNCPPPPKQIQYVAGSPRKIFFCPNDCFHDKNQGTCFMGQCFCHPGWNGTRCDEDIGPVPQCESDLHDICLYHPDNGINIVPYKRWRAASLGEEGAWRHSGNATEDRVAEHMEAYGGYQALVGRPIGKMIEVGCGPFTQSKYLFERMQQIDAGNKATHLTLVDPNIPSYVQNHNCQYRTGLLMPFRVPIQFISEGGETLRLRFQEEFDTVLMTNVLEHAYNAYDLLEGLYRILKPNGTLIFHERYHDNRLNDKEKYFTLENNQKLQPYDIGKLLHPLRAKKKVIDHLLSYFDIVYQNTNTTLMRWRKEEGIYAIAVKKDLNMQVV